MQKSTWQQTVKEKLEILQNTAYFVLMIVVVIMKVFPNNMQTAADTVANF